MSREEEFENFAIAHERNKSDRERWMKFEITLRYLLCELKDKTDREDSFLLDDIKQSIIVFVMKDKFEETNKIFNENKNCNETLECCCGAVLAVFLRCNGGSSLLYCSTAADWLGMLEDSGRPLSACNGCFGKRTTSKIKS